MDDELARWMDGADDDGGRGDPTDGSGDPGGRVAADGPAVLATLRADWAQEDEARADGSRQRRRRLRRLLLLAGVPWVVVVLAAVAGRNAVGTEAAQGAATQADHTEAPPAPDPGPSRAAAPPAPSRSPSAVTGPLPRDASTSAPANAAAERNPSTDGATTRPASAAPTAAAAAVVAVRSSIDAPEGRRRHVDLAVPEVVELLGDVAVVRVAAVVLEGPVDGRLETAAPLRFAVPLRVHDGVAEVLAAPWTLPFPVVTGSSSAFEHTAPDDPERVRAALEAAGYAVDAVRTTGEDAALAGVIAVGFSGVAPGEGAARDHVVWLRHDGTALVTLGTGEVRP